MSTYFYGHHQQPQTHYHAIPTPHLPSAVSNHSGGRSRRNPKIAAQNPPRQFRGVKSMRELAEAPTVTAFRLRFEAGRSFDLDDDMEFCPSLLTEDDFHSIHSSASDRSSMSSGSPNSSPLQHQVQPAQQIPTNISLSPASSASYNPSSVLSSNFNQLSYQQQSAARVRRSIPIVNPTTGVTLSSPPTSISPGIMQASQRRW